MMMWFWLHAFGFFCEFVKKVKDLLQQQMEYLYLMLKIRNFFVQNFKLVVEL